jgi:hypothetical protein
MFYPPDQEYPENVWFKESIVKLTLMHSFKTIVARLQQVATALKPATVVQNGTATPYHAH